MTDLIKLIHCKDCKNSEEWTDTNGKTGLICHVTYDEFGYWTDVKPKHFCGYAKEKMK